MATQYQVEIVMFLALFGLCPVIALFGIISNIINIIIFIKNGFAESINVSLLGLSISDLLALLFVVPFAAFMNPFVLHSEDRSFVPDDVVFVTISFPYSAFNRITCLITVFITMERCMCFVLPLKMKSVLTPLRSAIIISAVFAIVLSTLVPAYIAAKLDWRPQPGQNRTVLGMVFTRDDSPQLIRIRLMMALGLQLFSLVALVASNVALAIAVKRQEKWRATTTTTATTTAAARSFQQNEQQPQAASENTADSSTYRNRRLARMIQLLSLILFATYFPSTLFYLANLSFPEFSVYGKYRNEFKCCWTLGIVAQSLNSSVNIVFYYRMNTRFRNRLNKMFRRGVARVGIFPVDHNTMGNTLVTVSHRSRLR